MYSKSEAAEKKKEFWTAFGVYMRKHPATSSSKSRRLNYRTGVKDVYIRLEVDNRGAKVCIDLQHRDKEIRALFYEQFTELKAVLHSTIGEELIWEPVCFLEETDKEVSRIYTQLQYKNIHRKEEWGDIFRFLEQYIVPIEEFWADYRDIFIELEK